MANTTKRKSGYFTLILVIALVIGALLYSRESPSNQIETTPTTEVKGTTTSSTTESWYEVYFTNPKIPFDDVYTGGIENNLIQKIDAAQVSIDVAVFEFDIESVAEALIRAEQRGVDVRVVYDDEHSDPDPQIGEVKSAGIQAVPDKRQAYMHNKFFVFDDQCVWTGSFNISMNAAYRNNENALYFCSKEAAADYSTEFDEMFAGQFGPDSPSNTPYPSFTVGGSTVEVYFAPEDHVMDKVINAVSEADTSIHFMAYSFTDDGLANAMIADANRGVVIEGVFETTGADTQYSECGTLLKKGFDIRLDGNPRTFHHKVIIIDGDTVILGSFNYSSNADTQNDENLLIVHDASLAAAYEQQYQLIKSQAVVPSGTTCHK